MRKTQLSSSFSSLDDKTHRELKQPAQCRTVSNRWSENSNPRRVAVSSLLPTRSGNKYLNAYRVPRTF